MSGSFSSGSFSGAVGGFSTGQAAAVSTTNYHSLMNVGEAPRRKRKTQEKKREEDPIEIEFLMLG